MSIPLSWYLILAAALFCIGLFGVLSRKNAIAILLGDRTDVECRQYQPGGLLALSQPGPNGRTGLCSDRFRSCGSRSGRRIGIDHFGLPPPQDSGGG